MDSDVAWLGDSPEENDEVVREFMKTFNSDYLVCAVSKI